MIEGAARIIIQPYAKLMVEASIKLNENFEPNGNLKDSQGFLQEGICSKPVPDVFNKNNCTLNCCVHHDLCFQQNGCNASSWAGNVLAWMGLNIINRACQKCNETAKACFAEAGFGSKCDCKLDPLPDLEGVAEEEL